MNGIDHDQLAADFWRDGFIALPGFFDRTLMGHVASATSNHFGDTPAFRHEADFLSRSQTEVVPWFPQRECAADDPDRQVFDSLEQDPRLHALTEAVLGPGWRNDYAMVMFSPGESRGQAWHQDCPPEPNAFNLNRLVYPHDLAPGEGELMVVPGSHRLGELPAGEPHGDLADQRIVPIYAGALVVVHGHCWHRVTPIDRGPRYSLNLRCLPQNAPAELTDVCVYRNLRYRFSTGEVVVDRTSC